MSYDIAENTRAAEVARLCKAGKMPDDVKLSVLERERLAAAAEKLRGVVAREMRGAPYPPPGQAGQWPRSRHCPAA